jgi:DNA-binding transcriptional regulator YhcF (GntR family)
MILKFDFSSSEPLYMQLRNQIVIGIGEGKLKPGEKLPTIRALAEESGINMMTVSKAYQLLKQEGYITTDRRSGACVAGKKTVEISETTLKALRISISELRLSGMRKDDILALCRSIYEEGETK